jgi:uncharacterized protein
MIRLLLWAGIIYLLYRTLKNLIRIGPGPVDPGSFPKAPEQGDDLMVKDPYCGVYFPKRDGHHLRFGGEDLSFCSPACRDNYRKEHTDNGA